MQSLWGTYFEIFVLIVFRTTKKMEKYFKRLPRVNEGWRLKSTSKNDNMVKNNRWKRYKNIKKSSSEYRAEKITGFTNENVREKKIDGSTST